MLLILHAAVLSISASGQVAVNSIPYVRQYAPVCINNECVLIITSAPAVAPAPPAVSTSGFAGLMGGGFGSLLTSAVAPSAEAAATAITIASVRKANIVKSINYVKSEQARLQADADQALADKQARFASCTDTPNAMNAKGQWHARAVARAQAKGRWRPKDSSVCTLPEEDQAEQAEEELQSLTEAGNADEVALEAAEEAAEAAEVAAEAAEEAAEAAEIGIDVLESIVEACGLF